MDRVAVLIDAGYFFAAGSALVAGGAKLPRERVIFDENAAVNALREVSSQLSGAQPLLRIYWYDGASKKFGPSADHVRLANCNDVKVRLGFLNAAGQQKGVDSLIVTDLVELARNRAVADVVLMSGDEDVRIGVQLAQGFGVRVHLIGVKPSAGTQSAELRQEADTCTEWDIHTVGKILSIRPEPANHVAQAVTAPRASKHPARTSIGAGAAQTAFDDVVEKTLGELTQLEIRGTMKFMEENSKNIPYELDAKILARCRTANGGLNLDEQAVRSVRTLARKRIGEKAAPPASAPAKGPAKPN